ncbi:MAG: diguanylate cyclase [Lachnospiraceae bacterium]|nr:diguanylate cyclase [Lachnospiraceae bacterium]
MKDIMLVVDDNETNRAILKVLFEKEYEIMEAENGEKALEMLRICQGSIDVVLLDLLMEGMSGFDILKQRSELDYCRDVPVVVISGAMDSKSQIRAFDLGAADFITKPFVPEIVISRVNNVMSSHRRLMSVESEAKKLKIKSELDMMTGLYNKTTSEATINEILKNGRGKLNALMVIDIDNFKNVNDSAGHQAGDYVIKIVSDLLSSQFRKADIVGRIGGDEFVVLMVNVPSMNIVHKKANEIVQIMRYKPNLTIPDNVSLSIGIAVTDRMETTYQELFEKADHALLDAKESGKAQYREFGVEPVDQGDDDRPILLLISRSRSVCTAIQAATTQKLRVEEVIALEDLDKVPEKDIPNICVIHADVSDYSDDGAELWEHLKQYPWIDFSHVLAICQEGNTKQYQAALLAGVADVMTTPIDPASARRRFRRIVGVPEDV